MLVSKLVFSYSVYVTITQSIIAEVYPKLTFFILEILSVTVQHDLTLLLGRGCHIGALL